MRTAPVASADRRGERLLPDALAATPVASHVSHGRKARHAPVGSNADAVDPEPAMTATPQTRAVPARRPAKPSLRMTTSLASLRGLNAPASARMSLWKSAPARHSTAISARGRSVGSSRASRAARTASSSSRAAPACRPTC